MGPPPRRPRRWGISLPLVITGVAALVIGAGAGVAAAVTSSPTPSPSRSAASPSSPGQASSAPTLPAGPRLHRFGGAFGPGGFGAFGAIHGQFVMPKSGGGYQTVDTQRGQVTAVSKSSITLKSPDGFTKTYAVTSSTIVDAKRDGIGSVKLGDQVAVSATVSGGTATAARITDLSHLQSARGHFFGGLRSPSANSG